MLTTPRSLRSATAMYLRFGVMARAVMPSDAVGGPTMPWISSCSRVSLLYRMMLWPQGYMHVDSSTKWMSRFTSPLRPKMCRCVSTWPAADGSAAMVAERPSTRPRRSLSSRGAASVPWI